MTDDRLNFLSLDQWHEAKQFVQVCEKDKEKWKDDLVCLSRESEDPIPEESLFSSDLLGTAHLHIHLERVR